MLGPSFTLSLYLSVSLSLYFVFVEYLAFQMVYEPRRASLLQFLITLLTFATLSPWHNFVRIFLLRALIRPLVLISMGDVLTLEPVSCDGGDQLLIRLGLPLQCRRHVV